MPIRKTAITLLVLGLTGCAGFLAGPSGEEALREWRAEAAAIDGRLDQLQPVEGTWSRGDGEGTWRAWFEGDDLRAVHEQLRFGDYGERAGRLYYEDGVLRYYVADGSGIEISEEGGQQRAEVRREIVFDGAGREIARRQETAGAVGPVDPAIVVGARRHGAELKREAEQLRPR